MAHISAPINSGGSIDFDDIVCVPNTLSGNEGGGCSFFGVGLEGGGANVMVGFGEVLGVLGVLDAFSATQYLDDPSHTHPCP